MTSHIKDANVDPHLHPFLGRNSIGQVLAAMDRQGLDVLAFELLDGSIYPMVSRLVSAINRVEMTDATGIRLTNGKFLYNGREYNTLEDLHVLTVGYALDDATPKTEIRRVIDSALEHEALVVLDHIFVLNGRTRTAGHVDEKKEQEIEMLCREYDGQVVLEWNAYCHAGLRRFIQGFSSGFLALPGVKQATIVAEYLSRPLPLHSFFKLSKEMATFDDWRYDNDVNKKVLELSERLASEGVNVPVIGDTDLHARSPSHLDLMGTSRFITDIEGYTPKEALASMKRNVFAGNYRNVLQEASLSHVIAAFAVPNIFPKQFYKPRS